MARVGMSYSHYLSVYMVMQSRSPSLEHSHLTSISNAYNPTSTRSTKCNHCTMDVLIEIGHKGMDHSPPWMDTYAQTQQMDTWLPLTWAWHILHLSPSLTWIYAMHLHTGYAIAHIPIKVHALPRTIQTCCLPATSKYNFFLSDKGCGRTWIPHRTWKLGVVVISHNYTVR